MTQLEKALAMLIRHGGSMWTYQFCTEFDGLFIGHRGAARISDLARAYPEAIATDTSERTYRYSFRFDNTLLGLASLPDNLRQLAKEEIKKRGGKYEQEVEEPVYVSDGMVRINKVIKTIDHLSTD